MGEGKARFAVGSWDEKGVGSFEATGADRRTVLEAGLRAALTLVIGAERDDGVAGHSRAVPLRGEGDDLVALFADLLDDLFTQLDEYGAALRDVTVDGVVPRDRGGFVAWGYAAIADGAFPAVTPPQLCEMPSISADESSSITIHASLRRDHV